MSLAAPSMLSLSPFASPQSSGDPRLLEANVVRTQDGRLLFQYNLDANLGRIRVPARRVSRHVDELWKHTCFEAFIARANVAGDTSETGPGAAGHSIVDYCELNFSPSTEWAAYSFTGYREGMSPISMPTPPDVRVETTTATRLRMDVSVDTRHLFAQGAQNCPSGGPSNGPYRIALAAVIEDESGAISYWALKHAPARPDFHHPAGFILEV